MGKETASKKLKLFNTQQSPILLFFVLTIISIGLMSFDHRHGTSHEVKQYISLLNTPLKYIINVPSRVIQSIELYFSDQKNLNYTINMLQNEINLLQLDIQDSQLLENENVNLRKILQIKEVFKKDIVVAEIILPNQVNGIPQIIINKGRKQKIRLGSAVMNNKGLIGQIIQVENNRSKINPITSNQFAVSAISNKGRINTVISGTGSPNLEINQLPAYEAIEIGDYFLTSGLDDLYPKGIKIGKIKKIIPSDNAQFNKIIITPFASPLSFSQVMIINGDK